MSDINYDLNINPMLQCPVVGRRNHETLDMMLNDSNLCYNDQVSKIGVSIAKMQVEDAPKYFLCIEDASILSLINTNTCFTTTANSLDELLKKVPLDLRKFVRVDKEAMKRAFGEQAKQPQHPLIDKLLEAIDSLPATPERLVA